MPCKVCEDYLLEYLYDELDEKNKLLMDNHLDESGDCRKIFQDLQNVRDREARWPREEPPESLHTRIMAHAAEFQLQPSRRAGWAWMFRPVLTTAMVAIVASGIYLYTSRTQGPLEQKQVFLPEESYEAPETVFSAGPSAAPEERSFMMAMNDLEAGASVQDERPGPEKGLNQVKPVAPSAPAPQEVKGPSISAPDQQGAPAGIRDGNAPGKIYLAKNDVSDKMIEEPPDTYLRAQAVTSEHHEEERKEVLEGPIEEDKASSPGPSLLSKSVRSDRRATGKSALSLSLKKERGWVSLSGAGPKRKAKSYGPSAAISRVVSLSGRGHCPEAREEMDACIAESLDKADYGRGWLALARCFRKKGENEAAREMAQKALKIPKYSKEAEAFLLSLPLTSKQESPQ